jgi:site-specific recombinase XerC
VRQQIDRISGKIMARELKTKNSCRTLPLMGNVRKALLEHAKKSVAAPPPFNPYFELSKQGTVIASKSGTPLEPRNLARCFNALTKKAGLPHIKIHAMRHRYVKQKLKNN